MNELRAWQEEAITFFKEHNKCIIQAATGTGKTFLGKEIIKYVLEQDPELKILIVVPKNVILEDTWYKELAIDISLIDIGIYYGQIKEKAQITLTNMQNIEKVGIEEFDFIIMDEIHNYLSDRMLSYMKTPTKYKLGLTATLRRKDYKHWKMLELFDFNMFNYDLDTAVLDKVLNKFNFHNIGITMSDTDKESYDIIESKLHVYAQMRKAGKWDTEMQLAKYKLLDARKKLLGLSSQKTNIIYHLKEKLLKRKVIVFNEYNDAAQPTYWAMIDIGLKPCIFNTNIERKQRYENLNGYRKDKFDTIITTRALDEGYNLPSIDVALILCGGSNDRQMIQRVGRVLRKKKQITEIYQVYFLDTIEHEYALKRYALMKKSCEHYDEMIIK